ncbi:MAG: hypothetical protein LUE11_04785 [Clostridia bacterium]|nr:hypothetical protein [Clostridia bacterium]
MARMTGDNIGTFKPDNLIAGTYPPVQAFNIDLKESGVIERGTVMSFEDDGTYAVLGTGSGTASCIIADTTQEDDVAAVAYRSGCFFRDALICGTVNTTGEEDDASTTKEDYELTAVDENNLRLAGIVLTNGI